MNTKHNGKHLEKKLARYPWAKWFAKKRFVLIKGKDYDGATYGMIAQIRNAADPKRHNVKVSISTADEENKIIVIVLEHRAPIAKELLSR